MRQPDRDRCVGGGRFVLAQPGPLRGRERCHRPAAHPVRQPFSTDRLRERRRLWRGARVVPEHRGAQRFAIRPEHNEPVLLAPDRDGGDVPGATRLRERRPKCLPPFARVGFARTAFATDRVPGAATGNDAARLRVDHEHLRRLGRRIDARNQRAHATSGESTRREAARPPSMRGYTTRGDANPSLLNAPPKVVVTGPGRFVSGPWSRGYPPAATTRSAPRLLRRSPVTRGAAHKALPVGRPHPQVGSRTVSRGSRRRHAPAPSTAGTDDQGRPNSALVVRRERHVDVSLQRRHALTLKEGCVSVMTGRHDRFSRVCAPARRCPRPTLDLNTSG